MNIIYMGTPWFAVPTLEYLLHDNHKVSAVYTQPDKKAGRGQSIVSSPVMKKAIEYNLPVEQPLNFKEPGVVEQLASYHPDIILVFSYGQILPQSILDIPSRGCVNVHPSLLPKYRGAAPVVAAILAGDAFTGVSILQMSLKLDSGDILAQAQISVSDYDNTSSLTGKLSLLSAQLVLDVLPRLANYEIIPKPQDESAASYFGQLNKLDGEIDWDLPAVDIWRRVRAFNPWPGAFTEFRGKQLKIIEARPLPGMEDVKAGQVVALPEKGMLGTGTGDGILGITEVQLEGKRPMPAVDFIRGQRNITGTVLPSSS